MKIPGFLKDLYAKLSNLAAKRHEVSAVPLRDDGHVDQGRRELGARRQNHHDPIGHRDGEGAPTLPAKISVSPATVTENAGTDTQLTAVVLDTNNNNLNIAPDAWVTSDPAIATVSGTGLVHAVAGGTATISAQCFTSAGTVTSNPCTVTVVVTQDTTPASIVISPSTLALNAGDTSQLVAVVKNAAGDVLVGVQPSGWSSTDQTKATVSASGLVTAVAAGTATIAATLNAVTSNGCVATISVSGSFSGPAELPRRVPNINWTTPTIDGTTWTPANSDELTTAVAALATADPAKNHAIILALGVTYVGNWRLPNRGAGSGWVYIYTQEKHDGTFGKTASVYTRGVSEVPGQRVAYKDSILTLGASCKLAQVQNGGVANTPTFSLDFGAHHYWFEALELSLSPAVTVAIEGGHIDTTGFGATPQTVPVALSDVPHHINVGHCILRGSTSQRLRRGLYMNGSYVAARDCGSWYIWEDGADSQNFGFWQSPGALAVINCFGESGGENILGGGAGPDITDRPLPEDFMKDITVWNSHFTKDPTRSGIVKKNLFELKDGCRVLLQRCLLEHNTGEAQPGNTIPLVLINQDDLPDLPHDTSDIVVDTVKIYGGGAMFILSGWQKQGTYDPILRLRRVHVKNVYGKSICGTLPEAAGTTGFYFAIYNNAQDILIEHVTGEAVTTGISLDYQSGTTGSTNLEVRDCLLGKGAYASIFGPAGVGTAALSTAVNPNIHNNVFYAPDGTEVDDANSFPTNNFYVPVSSVGFAARVTQDPGALSAGSPYHNAATDNTDIGADVSAITAMETSVRETVLPWS